jgi:hypothetical protein
VSDFVHRDLFAYLEAARPKALGCLLGMVENWRSAGCVPLDELPFGGFEAWAATIGGIMWTAGLTQWRRSTATWRSTADVEGEDLRAFVEAWAGKGELGVTWKTSELFSLAEDLEIFQIFRVGKSREACEIKFGIRVLAQYADRPVNGYKIMRYPGAKRGIWLLTQCKKREQS